MVVRSGVTVLLYYLILYYNKTVACFTIILGQGIHGARLADAASNSLIETRLRIPMQPSTTQL
jgi:hypothetical protein